MALHYNLSKVYAFSDNNPELVHQTVSRFVTEVPDYLDQIKEGIKNKDHKNTYATACKIKPKLDLLGLKVAFEEILQVEVWTKNEGEAKEIKETFKSIKQQVKDAIKELKKDFNL